MLHIAIYTSLRKHNFNKRIILYPIKGNIYTQIPLVACIALYTKSVVYNIIQCHACIYSVDT